MTLSPETLHMPYHRVLLVAAQSIAYQLASTPPNKTPPKARFDRDHPWYIRIAPTVMKVRLFSLPSTQPVQGFSPDPTAPHLALRICRALHRAMQAHL
jgi:hypothetical protein